MNISEAIEAMKFGRKVTRGGWNGRGMFLIYVPGTLHAKLAPGTPYYAALGKLVAEIDPHIDMYTAAGAMQPGWLASQADLLAEDWEVVNG